MKSARLIPAVLLLGIGLTAGCASVSDDPTGVPSGGQPVRRGVEPEHAPIKTKDVPAGESSLRHSRPD